MEKDVPTVRFRTSPKNEQVIRNYTEIIMLNAKGPRIVHEMGLNYEGIYCYLNSMQPKLNNLHRLLEKLKCIHSLTVSLPDAHLENNMLLKNISLRIKHLYSLQILNLDLPYISWISLKGIEHLAGALAQMKLLKKLIMNFGHTNGIDDECLHLLSKSLKKYKNLQSFELDISHCEKVTKKSFKSLAWTLKHLQRPLKELCLGLARLDLIEGNALDLLASGLANLTGLQTLRINFSQLQVSSIDIYSSLMSSIKHLKSLKMLSLCFESLPMHASVLKHLASSFESLIHLHALSLSFGYSSTFAIQEMEVLAQCLKSTASSLKNLTLDFICCSRMNDQVLEKLSIGLKALTKLSEINLQCLYCPDVGDVGIRSVTYELGGLPDLHSVNLGFSYCGPIKDTYYNELKLKKNIKSLTFDYVRSQV